MKYNIVDIVMSRIVTSKHTKEKKTNNSHLHTNYIYKLIDLLLNTLLKAYLEDERICSTPVRMMIGFTNEFIKMIRVVFFYIHIQVLSPGTHQQNLKVLRQMKG